MSKNKNKAISIVLMILLILNSFSVVVMAETKDEVESKKEIEAENVGQLIDEHNNRYLSIYEGNAIAYNKKTKSDEEIYIGEFLSKAKSEMVFPLDKEYYSISSDFGVRRHPFTGTNGATEIHSLPFHAALDIAAANIKGANIYSVMSGVVSQVSRNVNSYGNLVVVDHGGIETYYAHMNEISSDIEVGKEVEVGEILGTVGTTGRSTGPHLHIEFVVGNLAINPRIFLEGGFEVKEAPNKVKPLEPKKDDKKETKPKDSKVEDFKLKPLELDYKNILDDNLDTIDINSVLNMENSFMKLEFENSKDVKNQDFNNMKYKILPLDKNLSNVGHAKDLSANKNIGKIDKYQGFKVLSLDKTK